MESKMLISMSLQRNELKAVTWWTQHPIPWFTQWQLSV